MVSVDTIEDNTKFAQMHEADYPILSDVTKEIATKYGVLSPAGMGGTRVKAVPGMRSVDLRRILDSGAALAFYSLLAFFPFLFFSFIFSCFTWTATNKCTSNKYGCFLVSNSTTKTTVNYNDCMQVVTFI